MAHQHPTRITLAQVRTAMAALGIPFTGTTMVTIDTHEVTIDGYAVDDDGRIIASGGEPTTVSSTIHIDREVSRAAAE